MTPPVRPTACAKGSLRPSPSRSEAAVKVSVLGSAPASGPLLARTAAFASRSRVALRPAKLLRADIEALPQRSARIGQAPDRLFLRVVDPPQLHRVHLECRGEFVHRALQREEVRRLRRSAHEPGGVAVGTDDA